MINWKVRINNKLFWTCLIPAVLLLITQIAGVFGIALDLTEISDKLLAIVGTIFMILTILGIVVDPTTKGPGDSELAMGYDKPSEL